MLPWPIDMDQDTKDFCGYSNSIQEMNQELHQSLLMENTNDIMHQKSLLSETDFQA
jgi:hypothetical protein